MTMKKRILPLLLTLVLCLGLLPVTASAAQPTLLSEFFPARKISTPQAAYLRYNGVDETYGDSIDMWYNLPQELLDLAAAYNKWEAESGDGVEFEARFGVYDYSIWLQTDAKIDGGAWQYTADWDQPDWGGPEVPHYLAFGCNSSVGVNESKFYETSQLSWLTYLEEGAEGFLAPILTTSVNEYGETIYHYDLTGHTLAVRYRYVLRYVTLEDGEENIVFSDWSPETSIGKNGAQKSLSAPTALAAPVLSEFSMKVTAENGTDFLGASYYLAVPDSIYDATKYCEVSETGSVCIDAQIRVNGGAWSDVYTANPDWIFSNYRSAAPDDMKLKESDSVEIRARFVCEALGLTSPWSNVVGTAPTFQAHTWALDELNQAAALGLIPDCLQGADLTKPITRAEFAAVSVKVYESLTGTKAEPIAVNPFKDTNDVEVLKAFNVGVTNGTGDGTTFSPNVLLNREQAATMLTRVYKKVLFDGWTLETDGSFAGQFKALFTAPAPFADDTNISGWAKDSVYFMAANGIINGVGDNKFAPKAVTESEKAMGYAQATREQALLIAARMVKNLGE